MESLISIPTKGPIDRKGRVRTLETLLSLADLMAAIMMLR
jgi:hypothetical protein